MVRPAAPWKRVVAAILDLVRVVVVAGYPIALATGDVTPSGFRLHGTPALLWFALIALYFFVGRRYAGGTVFDRLFGIGRPQPLDVFPTASGRSAGVRAGVWRRGLALVIDSLIISVVC